VSKTFSRKKAAQDWGRKEEDRLRSLLPGSAIDRTVSEAIKRYAKDRLLQLRSSVVRKGHLDWWDDHIGHLKHIASEISGVHRYQRLCVWD
jgi:hypothetical protein